ncbi:Mitochodrial transcription termination factor-related [Spatholobus suberectus]|nr:Mitochodrial transcription termination factor-related [Spatholobus suberectus]
MVPNFLLIARLTASSSSFTRYKSTRFQLGSHSPLQHKHNASLFNFNSFTSARNHHKGDTFTVSYLVNSCGVSPTLASTLSNRLNLKNPDGPDAVIDLLNNYGFDKTQVAKLVEKHPSVLAANAENTLLPKLKFLRSIGVSNTDMPKILLRNHVLLMCSLENCLIPRYEILRGIVHDDQKVVRIFKNAAFSITYGDVMNHLVPNIKFLRQSSVPQASISVLMTHFPSTAYLKHYKFVEAVNTAKGIGFDPLKITFIKAVIVLLTTRKTMRDSKFEVYERWGWNHDMALRAFRKFPDFMMLSKEAYAKKMSFLVKDMGLPPQDIAEYPLVLSYSLEKRIIPRFSVIKILQSKGLLKNDLHFGSFMCITEENFLKKFVTNFLDDLPLLSDVYKGLINHQNEI